MVKILIFLRRFPYFPVSLRFFLSSATNYLFANLIFTLLWLNLNSKFSYFLISLFSSTLSIGFSMLIHRIFTLEGVRLQKRAGIVFYLYHASFFFISLILVPIISTLFHLNLLFVQYIWVFAISLGGVFLLRYYRV